MVSYFGDTGEVEHGQIRWENKAKNWRSYPRVWEGRKIRSGSIEVVDPEKRKSEIPK